MPRGPRVPARNDLVSFAIFFSAWASSVTSAVSCSGSLENTRCVDALSSPSRSDIARSTSTITGMPRRTRLGAQIGAEFGAAALGEDGGAIVQQRVEVGQLDIPQFRIAEGHDGALAGRIDHDRRDRRHQARHVDEMLGLDALMRHLLEDEAAGCFLGVAHRAADRGAAAEPDDADRGIERVAAADFVEMRWRSPWSRARERRACETSGRAPACRCTGCAAGFSAPCRESSFRNPSCRLRHVPEPMRSPEVNRFGPCVGSRYAPRVVAAMQPAADQMVRDRERMRGEQAVGVLRVCASGQASARSNQRASSSSVRSTTMSSLVARAVHPIISDDG